MIINTKSKAVFDFFEKSFYVTDQFDGLRAFYWDDQLSDEMTVAIPSAYLMDEVLQKLVSDKGHMEINLRMNLDLH